MAKAEKVKSGNKPVDKMRQGNMEVVVWPHVSRKGKPFRTYSLTRHVTDYEKQSSTWQSLHGLTRTDLSDLSRMIGSILESDSSAKQALDEEMAEGGEQ